MPSTSNSQSGTVTRVVRDIHIHEATTSEMVENGGHGVFYESINSELIAIVQSDNNGFFQIELEPGKYSFFVKEGELFWGSRSDDEGHIVAAEVLQDIVTQVTIDINYMATY